MVNLFDQSYEIVDYEEETVPSGWNSDRRCGHIFHSGYYGYKWIYNIGTTHGGREVYNSLSSEHRCNCPRNYGPYTQADGNTTNTYTAMCLDKADVNSDGWTNSVARSWIIANTCPKGWGKSSYHGTNTNYVKYGQGYVVEGYREPIYGYVTRYRTKYYTYISSRVAKI